MKKNTHDHKREENPSLSFLASRTNGRRGLRMTSGSKITLKNLSVGPAQEVSFRGKIIMFPGFVSPNKDLVVGEKNVQPSLLSV